MSSTPAPTPPKPLITSTDHGGLITITAACGMTFALLAMLIRIYARAAINGPWSHDDTTLAVSMVLCVGQSVAKMVAVSNGLGKMISLISPMQLIAVEKNEYASDILFPLSLYFSKVSAVFLFLRLTPNKHHVRFCWSILGTSTVWAIASVFVVSFRCHLPTPWIMDEQCSNMFLRWQVIGAFDILTEVALFAMAIFLVLGLRISIRLKLFVVAAFAFRIPVIVFVILRLHYLHSALLSSDPTFSAVLPSIWTQVEVDYSIIASTIPCLKPFMVACNTGWGHVPPQTGDGSAALKSGGSYGLRSLDKSGVKNTASSYAPGTELGEQNLRGDTCKTVVEICPRRNQHHDHNGDETSQSIASNDSTQMIIRREVGWTVTYDDDNPTPGEGGPPNRSDIEAQTISHGA